MTIALALLVLAGPAAAAELPADRLGSYAEPVRRVMDRPTVHEIVGPIETPLSLEVSDFLLGHPDLSAWLVRRHRIAPYVIELRGPNRSWADDGDGTTGFIDLVDEQPSLRVYYTEGTHHSSLFPDIRAAAVVLMEIRPAVKEGCPESVSSSFEVYLRLRSGFLSAMVKVLRPFIRGVLIRKFTRAFSVAQKVGVLLAQDPEGVRREILSYPGFSPEDRASAERLLSTVGPRAPACL